MLDNKEVKIGLDRLVDIVNFISDHINVDPNIMPREVIELTLQKEEKKVTFDFTKIKRIYKNVEINSEKDNLLNVTWGKIKLIKENEYEIFLSNKIKLFTKQKFTLAREYIHFIIDTLHLNNIVVEDLNIKQLEVGCEMQRCNEYENSIKVLASKLIVSDEKLNKFIGDKDINQKLVFDIAMNFELSFSAAELRLEYI